MIYEGNDVGSPERDDLNIDGFLRHVLEMWKFVLEHMLLSKHFD